MGIFKKLSDLFNPPGPRKAPEYAIYIQVKCNRCSEVIQSRIDLRNDLTIDYENEGANPTYFCRKVLMGDQHCFQKVEVELTFDSKRKIIKRQISGGEFVESK